MTSKIIINKKFIEQPRGRLSIATFSEFFQTKRFFIIDTVPAGETRGNHAHKTCTQIMSCLTGQIDILLDDGQTKNTVILKPESEVLIVPPGIWSTQTFKSDISILLVLADEDFNEDEYIRDYNQFIKSRQHGK